MPIWLIGHWRLALTLGLVAVLAAYIGVLRIERGHYRDQRDKLQAQMDAVMAIGEQAKKTAAAKEAADKAAKEKVDADHKTTVAALDARIASLRAQRPRRSFVPAAAACPDRPASAAFDRAVLERALRDLDAGVQGLVDEGSRAVADLDAAKQWAQTR